MAGKCINNVAQLNIFFNTLFTMTLKHGKQITYETEFKNL